MNINHSRRNKTDLLTNSDAIKSFVGSLVEDYLKNRSGRGLSVPQKDDCYRNFEILILDLLSAYEADPNLTIGYSRGHGNYTRGGSYWDFNNNRSSLSEIYYLEAIAFLNDNDFLTNLNAVPGYTRYSSRMVATKQLAKVFEDIDINWTHVCSDPRAPNILVKSTEKKIVDAEPEEFDLERAKANLRRINENLCDSLVNLNISDADYHSLIRSQDSDTEQDDDENSREPIDFSNRCLKRIFGLGNYRNGGRFYGGWWQLLPSKYRKYIEIEGMVTVELDYSTMAPAMLYAQKNARPPHDAYTVPEWDYSVLPEDDFRKIVKKAFNQLLNSKNSSRNPNQWHRFSPDLKPETLPNNWLNLSPVQRNVLKREEFQRLTGKNYSKLLADLMNFHAPIEDLFFSQNWGRVQFLDSSIAEKVMIKMLDHTPAVTVLPIHDSFIVRKGMERVLEEKMSEAFNEVIGSTPVIENENRDHFRRLVSNSRIVFGDEIAEQVTQHQTSHRNYHVREAQWKARHGQAGYE